MSLNLQVLDASFDLVKPQGADFVTTFYEILFSDYPETQRLFARVPMIEQREKLLSALVLMVHYFHQPATLADALGRLGDRHTGYGVQPAHYAAFWNVFRQTMGIVLDEAWTPDVEAAWTAAYAEIVRLMTTGAAATPPPMPATTQETLLSYWVAEPEIVAF